MSQQLETPRGAVTIRPVHEADAVAYRELRIEALRTVPTAFGSDVASTEARTLEQWQQQMRDGTGTGATVSCVAEAAGILVGMAVFQQETGVKLKHQANIYSVYLRPDWRGVGLLDALIAYGSAWVSQRSVRMLKLSVSANNAPAIRAYIRLGFQMYGLDPEAVFWDDMYYDELLMYKRLESDQMTR